MIRHWKTWATEQVIVNLKSGSAFAGVLWQQRGPLLVLREATMHKDGEGRRVDGEVVVRLEDVDFVQVVRG